MTMFVSWKSSLLDRHPTFSEKKFGESEDLTSMELYLHSYCS